MNQYVGLDVSLEETKVHVLDEAGGRVWRGKCASHPDELESTICKHAPGAVRIGLETGPLTTWLWTVGELALALRQETYRPRAGWYKEVRVKSRDAMLSKAVSAARRQLLDISTNLSNQVRGLMKTFGLVLPKGKGRIFEANVRGLFDEEHALAAVVLPLLEAWCAIRNRAAELDRLLVRKVRRRTVARAALRGRNRDPDPGALCQRAALLGSGAQDASRLQTRRRSAGAQARSGAPCQPGSSNS